MIAESKSRFMDTLINTLAFGEVSLRIAALEMIRKYYEKALFGLLMQALKDSNEKVRVKTVDILATVDDARALKLIRSAENDVAESVRERVKKVLQISK
jgi:HEAT repeat protein